MKVVLETLQVLPAAYETAHFFVERLHTHFELQRALGKPRDGVAKSFRQAIGNHFKVEEQYESIYLQEKFQDLFADAQIQIEGAIDKLKLRHASLDQLVQFTQ